MAAGVTLVELLVAVGLVAVLLLLVFPLFKGAAEMQAATQCASRLREIAVVLHAYTAENNGRLPPGRFGTSVSCWFSIAAVGMTEEGKYAGSTPGRLPYELLQCPSKKDGYSWSPWRNVGYTYNSTAGKRSIFSNPAPNRTPLVWDGNGLYASGYYGWADFLRFSDPNRHQGRLKMLMLDGHVEARGEKELRAGDSNKMSPDLIWSW